MLRVRLLLLLQLQPKSERAAFTLLLLDRRHEYYVPRYTTTINFPCEEARVDLLLDMTDPHDDDDNLLAYNLLVVVVL